MIPTVYIGRDFFDDPCGRYYTDGDGSGEEFREEVLKPLLTSLPKLRVNINIDVEGYDSSFLVEAFGGLIKHGYFTSEKVREKLIIETTDSEYEFFEKKINEYILKAKYNSEEYKSSKEKAISLGVYKSIISKDFVNELIRNK